MKNVFKKYNWLFQWISAAILIAVGVSAGFVGNVVLTITGVALLIFGFFRIIPLLKTTVSKTMKVIFIIEALVNILVGIALIYLATKEDTEIKKAYGYLLGGILYARSFIYFFGTSIKKEDTDFAKFIAHIIFITVGTWSVAIGGFTDRALGYVILAIALLAATVLVFIGSKNYKNYRYEYAAKSTTKNKTIVKEDELFPTKEKEPIKENDIIIPINEEEKKDDVVIQ